MKKDSLPLKSASLATEVPGIWKLTSRVDTDSSGRRHFDPVLGSDPLGILCFSKDHFAAQFMKRDRSQSQDTPQLVRAANNSSAVNGYDAYFGTYTLDEGSGTLKTRLEGAITPSNIGSEFERHIEVRGKELTISLATMTTDGKPITRTLTFTRLA